MCFQYINVNVIKMPTISLSLTDPLYRDVLSLGKTGEDIRKTIRRLIREAADSKVDKREG